VYLLATETFDLRKHPNELNGRAIQLEKFAKNKFSCSEENFQWCLNTYNYMLFTLQELADEFDRRELSKNDSYMNHKIICCSSCYTGCGSVSYSEIEEQRNKYDGEYICKSCESNAKILSQTQDIKSSYIKHKQYIAKDGIYYDEGARKKGTSMLGFAGRWWICRTKENVWITNNLFVNTSLHKKLLPLFEHNINFEFNYINKEEDIQKYCNNGEYNQIKTTYAYKYFIE